MSKTRLRAVFEKIGGEEKLQEILRDFYRRMSRDLLIGFFFSGKNPEHVADQQKNFLLFAVGLTSNYAGRSPTQAHLEMAPILKGHFDRRLVLLQDTLKDHGVDSVDAQTWIDFEDAFRNVVQA